MNLIKADKQLNFWKIINKEYKLNNKDGWCIAEPKKRKGVTKITGIKYADSKAWKLGSNNNIYKFCNKIDWYKEWNPNGKIVGTFNLIKAKENQYLTNNFPTSTKGTLLRVKYNNLVKNIHIKEMGFGNMNKSILPGANKKIIKAKGATQIEFCGLAVFQKVQIKVFEGVYLRIIRDKKQKLPDLVAEEENQKRNSFHFGIGYCKLRDNEEYLHSIIAISPKFINQTSIQVVVHEKQCHLSVNITQKNHKRMLCLYNSNNGNGSISSFNLDPNNHSSSFIQIHPTTNVEISEDNDIKHNITNDITDNDGFNMDTTSDMSHLSGNTISNNISAINNSNNKNNNIDEDIDLQLKNGRYMGNNYVQTGYRNIFDNESYIDSTNIYNECNHSNNYSYTNINNNNNNHNNGISNNIYNDNSFDYSISPQILPNVSLSNLNNLSMNHHYYNNNNDNSNNNYISNGFIPSTKTKPHHNTHDYHNMSNKIQTAQWQHKAKAIIDSIDANISFDAQRQIVQFLEKFQRNHQKYHYTNNNNSNYTYNHINNNCNNIYNNNCNFNNYLDMNPVPSNHPPRKRLRMLHH